jgi:hypothetical protein
MTSRAQEYNATSQEFLTKARAALAQDDSLQASEKGWGAAALAVKGLAQRRGWQHQGHRELFGVVDRLVEETGDAELRGLFNIANSLHINFYENWMSRVWVEDGVGKMEEFLRKLVNLP